MRDLMKKVKVNFEIKTEFLYQEIQVLISPKNPTTKIIKQKPYMNLQERRVKKIKIVSIKSS